MDNDISSKLKAKFLESEIEWRVQQCGLSQGGKPWVLVVPFIQARAIQNRLDDVFGWLNWEDKYRQTSDGKGWICSLSANVQGRIVTKENGADETNIEKTKGGISDSFKRVASSGFGIGRYLYEYSVKFAECTTDRKIAESKNYTERASAKNGNTKTTIYWKFPLLDEVGKFLSAEQKTEISKRDKEIVAYVIKNSTFNSIDEVPGKMYNDFLNQITYYEKKKAEKKTNPETVSKEDVNLLFENIRDRLLDVGFWNNAICTMFEIPNINSLLKSDFEKFYSYISKKADDETLYATSNKDLMITMEKKLKKLENKIEAEKAKKAV